jgi:phosphoglycerol transferase MdoB-like AlkP superfamily enzyme
VPEEPWEQFQGINHVSTFVRSGVTTAYELTSKGWMDFDTLTSDQLRAAANEPCRVSGKPPNIIMVLDEASFDASVLPGIKLPAGYGEHFRSFDGKTRSLFVEGSGGPTWYTEYNVLTGLSARSYGRLSYYVTRIAAGRVERGLPRALHRCGYKTISLYPAYGAFLSAKKFQETTGVGRFVDSAEMKAGDFEPDRFYFNKALKMIESEQGDQPLFIMVYTMFNHFPWWNVVKPELTPDWRALGNDPELDEYLRRQTLSARNYADFKQRLATDFPGKPFLVVRFGDHQPGMARIIDPSATEEMISQRIMNYDPRYFTTYYALDGINFTPRDITSALDRLEAPYLPIVVQEAAGLPLDPSFAEQKKILERCHGLFFQCAGGAEVRRFNRLLIDAGLIKGMVSR